MATETQHFALLFIIVLVGQVIFPGGRQLRTELYCPTEFHFVFPALLHERMSTEFHFHLDELEMKYFDASQFTEFGRLNFNMWQSTLRSMA